MDQNENQDQDVESPINEIKKAYIAGMLDGNATIAANISKNEDYAHGYGISCRVRLTRNLPFALQFIMDFCTDRGLKAHVKPKSPNNVEGMRYEFTIQENRSIKEFLRMVYPYMHDRPEDAALLSEEIIPAIENGEHLEKESFIGLVKKIDDLRDMNPHVTRAKYDLEYFQEEWDLK